jgi:hypothetical protein
MRKIRDILRLRLAAGLSIRQIKDSTKVSIGAGGKGSAISSSPPRTSSSEFWVEQYNRGYRFSMLLSSRGLERSGRAGRPNY